MIMKVFLRKKILGDILVGYLGNISRKNMKGDHWGNIWAVFLKKIEGDHWGNICRIF